MTQATALKTLLAVALAAPAASAMAELYAEASLSFGAVSAVSLDTGQPVPFVYTVSNEDSQVSGDVAAETLGPSGFFDRVDVQHLSRRLNLDGLQVLTPVRSGLPVQAGANLSAGPSFQAASMSFSGGNLATAKVSGSATRKLALVVPARTTLFVGWSLDLAAYAFGAPLDDGTGGATSTAFASIGVFARGLQPSQTEPIGSLVSIWAPGLQAQNQSSRLSGTFEVRNTSFADETMTVDASATTTGSERALAIPEPSTWALMAFGLGAVAFSIRRRRP
jgi:hypothetical protein